MNDEPILVDITAKLRRDARREAAKVLAAAGWSVSQISLAFGIGLGAAMQLVPRGTRLE